MEIFHWLGKGVDILYEITNVILIGRPEGLRYRLLINFR